MIQPREVDAAGNMGETAQASPASNGTTSTAEASKEETPSNHSLDVAGAGLAAAYGRILSGDEVFDLLNGNSSDGTMLSGGVYKEYYAKGGDIRMKSHAGKWWMKENQFCTSYHGMKSSNCYDVRTLPGGGIVWEQDGAAVGFGRAVSGNPNKF